MPHPQQVALALFADIGHQQQPVPGFRQPCSGLTGARDRQQGGKPGAVIGNPGAAEAPVGVHRDIFFTPRRQHRIQMGRQRHVRRPAESRQHIAGAIDGRVAPVGTKLFQKPRCPFLFHKGGRGNPAKLQMNLVDPLLLSREKLQAFADYRVVREFADVHPR